MIRIRRILVLAALLAACVLMLTQCMITPIRSGSTASRSNPAPRPAVSQPVHNDPPQSQSRPIIYARGKTHQVVGVVTLIRGGYQIQDDKSDTIFIFINLSRADAERFQRMVGKRMSVRMNVVSGENTRSINARVVGF